MVAEIPNPLLACADGQFGQFALAFDHVVDAFLERRLRNQAMHLHMAALSYAVGAIVRLGLDCRVPREIEMDDARGGRQVQPGAAALE